MPSGFNPAQQAMQQAQQAAQRAAQESMLQAQRAAQQGALQQGALQARRARRSSNRGRAEERRPNSGAFMVTMLLILLFVGWALHLLPSPHFLLHLLHW